MRSFLLKGGPIILFLIGLGFDVSDFFGSTALPYVIWVIAGAWALYLVWAWLKGGTGEGHVESKRGVGMGGRRNNEPEEPRSYIDKRSINTSNSPYSQQAMGDIINQGPQPRTIHQTEKEALVTELRKHQPEQFQVTRMTDAESSELGLELQKALKQGGWHPTMDDYELVAATPMMPRGVVVETTAESDAITALIEWLNRVGLNPQVNSGDPKFAKHTRGVFDDKPPPSVHIVVGVLPR